jgi:hypothetical protein
VPEVSVHEHREPDTSENEVGCAEDPGVVAAETKSESFERDGKAFLGLSFRSAYRPHDAGSSLLVKNVGHVPVGLLLTAGGKNHPFDVGRLEEGPNSGSDRRQQVLVASPSACHPISVDAGGGELGRWCVFTEIPRPFLPSYGEVLHFPAHQSISPDRENVGRVV